MSDLDTSALLMMIHWAALRARGMQKTCLIPTNPTVVPCHLVTNPTIVPCHLQTLQLFPTTYKPYSCSHAAENHDYSAQARARVESLSLPESARIAEYSIKHDYSAQPRAESHSAPLRVRAVQNTG